MLTALMLFVAGSAITRTNIVPRWLGFAAWVVALVNLAFVPSVYFGKDPTAFYSAIGWGNTALVGSLITYWIIGVAVALLMKTKEIARKPRR